MFSVQVRATRFIAKNNHRTDRQEKSQILIFLVFFYQSENIVTLILLTAKVNQNNEGSKGTKTEIKAGVIRMKIMIFLKKNLVFALFLANEVLSLILIFLDLFFASVFKIGFTGT